MPDEKERISILLEEYRNQTNWQRHNENQRAQLASILLAISAALITLFPKDRPLTLNDWPIPVLLIVIGIFGILAVMKYWERFNFHGNIGHHFHSKLSEYFDDDLLVKTYEDAEQEHNKDWKPKHFKKNYFKDEFFMQHWLWAGVFTVIIFLGISFLVRVFCAIY